MKSTSSVSLYGRKMVSGTNCSDPRTAAISSRRSLSIASNRFLPKNHLDCLSTFQPTGLWTFLLPLSVYLLHLDASIRRAVTWWWPTSGTAEADGVASHWATSSYTCLDHLRHIPGIHANHWATLSYTCLSHLAICIHVIHVYGPLFGPRTAQPACKNICNICRPFGPRRNLPLVPPAT